MLRQTGRTACVIDLDLSVRTYEAYLQVKWISIDKSNLCNIKTVSFYWDDPVKGMASKRDGIMQFGAKCLLKNMAMFLTLL